MFNNQYSIINVLCKTDIEYFLPIISFPQTSYMRYMMLAMPGIHAEQSPETDNLFLLRVENSPVIPIIIGNVFQCFVPACMQCMQ